MTSTSLRDIFFILAVTLYGVGTGGGVFTAQFWGKKDIAGIRKTVGLSLSLGILIAIIFTTSAVFSPVFPATSLIVILVSFLSIRCFVFSNQDAVLSQTERLPAGLHPRLSVPSSSTGSR